MYNIVSPDEIKEWLDIKGNSKDRVFQRLASSITSYVESYLSLKIITRRFVEYYDSKEKCYLYLNNYPVYKINSIYLDPLHVWGSETLVDEDDYFLNAKNGLITFEVSDSRIQNRLSAKVDYWGGFSRFYVPDEHYIDVKYNNTVYSVLVTSGEYIAEDLESELQTVLRDNVSDGFVVKYSHKTQRFTISNVSSFELLWKSGANSNANIADIIGFYSEQDDKSSNRYVGDFTVNGVPEELKMAALKIAYTLYNESKHKGAYQDIVSENNNNATTRYLKEYAKDVYEILNRNRRIL